MSEHITSPLKAIKAKCLDCCCDNKNEVKECPAQDCDLWPFRLGKNPFRKKRELTEEQRRAVSERFKNIRNKKETTNNEQEEE